jgi:SAM-dependent methyltransferase
MKRLPYSRSRMTVDRLMESVLARLPAAARRPARRVLFFPADLLNAAFGDSDPFLPPRGARAVGAGEFRSVGEIFLALFRDWGGLEPSHRVLDVGCGIGRMAVPLTGYLDSKGSYLGFDVVRSDVSWCRRAIARRFPRFRFELADVASAEYNPRGRVRAEEFSFPAAGSSVDFVIATSIFTHLLPEAARRYLSEIARVLVPGGRCFLTAFVLDDVSRTEIAAQRVSYRFETAIPGGFVENSASPEAAVAYDEEAFERMLRDAGLRRTEWHRGFWAAGRSPSYQDVVICTRDREG